MYSLFTYEVFRLLVLVLYQSTLRSSTMPRLRMTLYKSADRLVSGEIQWSGRLTRPVRQFLYNANQAARCRNNYRRDENLTIVYMTELHVSTYKQLARSFRSAPAEIETWPHVLLMTPGTAHSLRQGIAGVGPGRALFLEQYVVELSPPLTLGGCASSMVLPRIKTALSLLFSATSPATRYRYTLLLYSDLFFGTTWYLACRKVVLLTIT